MTPEELAAIEERSRQEMAKDPLGWARHVWDESDPVGIAAAYFGDRAARERAHAYHEKEVRLAFGLLMAAYAELQAENARLRAVADAARVRMDVVMGMTGWAKADADLRGALHALDNPHLPADAVEREAP